MHRCTCNDPVGSMRELCAACKQEWAEWLEDDLRQARSAQAFGPESQVAA